MQGRQHTQSVAGDMKKELGTAISCTSQSGEQSTGQSKKIEQESGSVNDSISQLLTIVSSKFFNLLELKISVFCF